MAAQRDRSSLWRFVASFLFLFLTGVVLAQISRYLPLEEQMKRAVARIYLPVLDWSYSNGRRDDVTIVQVDDEDLQAFGADWPVSYWFHRDRLFELTLARPEGQRPKAILIDVLFIDPREEEDTKGLAEMLCRISDAGIGVFLASLNWRKPEYAQTHAILRRPPQAGGPGLAPVCATEVSVVRREDDVDHAAWEYETRSGLKDGERPMDSAALAMFRYLDAQRAARVSIESPLALIWGSSPHPFNAQWMRPAPAKPPMCRDEWKMLVMAKTLWAALTEWTVPARKEKSLCPYNRVLPARALLPQAVSPAVLQDALDNRAVIYGFSLQSTGDVFRSPLHGLLPGPHLHAMALDNMITLEGRTKRSHDFSLFSWSPAGQRSANAFTLLALAFLAALMVTARALRVRYEPVLVQRWVDRSFASCADGGPRLKRVYYRTVWTYRLARALAAGLLYAGVALIVATIGYAIFDLGPLAWIEYALFLMLAHFLHVGEYLERTTFWAWRNARLMNTFKDVQSYRRSACRALLAKGRGEKG